MVYVLSEEEQPGCEKGFVSAELMKKYADLTASTFFLCGPKAMYDFIGRELAPLQLPLKALHRDATCCGDLPLEQPAEFRLTVHMRDEVFVIPAKENETLLTAMERAGLNAPNKCRAGGCGFCHSKWIAGGYRVAEGRDGRHLSHGGYGDRRSRGLLSPARNGIGKKPQVFLRLFWYNERSTEGGSAPGMGRDAWSTSH